MTTSSMNPIYEVEAVSFLKKPSVVDAHVSARPGTRTCLSKLGPRVYGIIAAAVACVIAIAVFLAVWFLAPGKEKESAPLSFVEKTSYQNRVLSSGAAADCTDLGRLILQQNGSAVDAAITVSLCAGLHNPEAAGIGSGSLMLVFNETTDYGEVYDSLSVSPLNSSAYEYNDALSSHGGMSAAVPGAVAGYVSAWQEYGRLQWKDLIDPVINMCHNGIPVSRYTADSLSQSADLLGQSEGFRDEFFRGQKPLEYGAKVYRRRLCKTLETLAQDKGSFYKGALAKDILSDIAAEGGRWNMTDLDTYAVVRRQMLRYYSRTADFVLLTPPAPSFGMFVGQALKSLSGYSFTPSSISRGNDSLESTSLTYHRVIESFKFAFARRSEFGDPVFDEDRRQEVLEREMRAADYADQVRSKIKDDIAYNHSFFYRIPLDIPRGRRAAVDLAPSYNYGTDNDSFSSLHISVTDSWGLSVSMTTTLSSRFGSKIMGNRTGIIFNSGMSEFARAVNPWQDAGANKIEPRKRAMTFMCPSMVIDNKSQVRLVLGAVGGPKAITATVWTVLNLLVFNKTLSDSVFEPRLHHQLTPDIVTYDDPAGKPEAALREYYITSLRRRRQRMEKLPRGRAGYVYAVAKLPDGKWVAAADLPGTTSGY